MSRFIQLAAVLGAIASLLLNPIVAHANPIPAEAHPLGLIMGLSTCGDAARVLDGDPVQADDGVIKVIAKQPGSHFSGAKAIEADCPNAAAPISGLMISADRGGATCASAQPVYQELKGKYHLIAEDKPKERCSLGNSYFSAAGYVIVLSVFPAGPNYFLMYVRNDIFRKTMSQTWDKNSL